MLHCHLFAKLFALLIRGTFPHSINSDYSDYTSGSTFVDTFSIFILKTLREVNVPSNIVRGKTVLIWGTRGILVITKHIKVQYLHYRAKNV